MADGQLRGRSPVCAVLAIALVLAGGSEVGAQESGVAAGRLVYERECAACHGAGGTGHGPSSVLLRQQPPDLTRLSSGDRPFDPAVIGRTITGLVRHGNSEMPKWSHSLAGPSAAGGISELDALLAYLADIQVQRVKPGEKVTTEDLVAAGSTLFTRRCTMCHGPDGRGPDVSGNTVGVAAPDLTTIAARRAGSITVPRIVELIARHDPDSAMPSWGDVLRRQGWTEVVIQANLEALAWFIYSIQRPAAR